jgi:serine/threonine protein kinase
LNPEDSAAELVRVLDQYLADLQAGRAPDRARLLANHPGLATQLDQCLAGLEFIHRATQPARETPAQLGDFRIVREIGHGGMGVVYEAEQLSLKRRVALKVLRFGAVADQEAMERFQREAETVARLHHTNIVPIFAIGCEQGVYYYAMQYIAGKSLAAVHEEGQQKHPTQARSGGAGTRETMNRSSPPTPARSASEGTHSVDFHAVARWGLQAAEALAHAHQRGVIHRDVKPSNLLLDESGTVWLTDFGLARRADEVTLTMTGVLMGTPRYMSPEQAAAVKQPLDQRTDIYSLGATLYELATGKPVFDADTPQGVITQILHAEPVAPRLIQAQLPRDLETILLKCLAKEPARRYATAAALADDLRAFLDGRPIQARRPTLWEQSARWLRKHRSSAALMGTTAAAAVLLMIAGLIGADRLEKYQKGYLLLTTEGPVLTAEVLDRRGEPVLPRFTVPTEEPLALRAGEYQLRVWGRGFLDETFQVGVERGKEQALSVRLNEQRPWEPVEIPRCYELAPIQGRHDVLSLSKQGVSRLHGGTGATLWTANLGPGDHPALAGWRWDWDARSTPSGRNGFDRRPLLVRQAPDLNGDGVPDLVWTSRWRAGLLALSGKDGKVLWCYTAPEPKSIRKLRDPNQESWGAVVGMPTVADVDGDGTPDLIAAFVQPEQEDHTVPRWVEAISGRTGKSLWRYDLAADWFTPPPGTGVPQDAQWYGGTGIAIGGIHQFVYDQLYEKDWQRSVIGGVGVPYAPQLVRVEGRPIVVVAAGTRLLGLDLRSGQPTWPAHDLGFWPVRAPQAADLDGDGHDDLLLHRQDAKENVDDAFTLTAVSLKNRATLWQATVRAYWAWSWFQQPFEWPIVADLDGDGKPEVIVPTGDRERGSKWSGIEVLSGATGERLWQRKLIRSTWAGKVQQVNRIVVGPDLDGDGHRDVFTAVLDGEEWRRDRPYSSIHVANFDKNYQQPILLIDALSGKDGHSLWWSRQRMRIGSLTTSPGPSVAPLRWWHAGADGWPQLVVTCDPGQPHTNYILSALSGKLLHTGSDCRDVEIADLDGDGIPDLVAFRPDQSQGSAFDHGGQLEVIRGRSPEAWRRLGGELAAGGDLDGDGIPDLITAEPNDERRLERDKKAATQRKPAGVEKQLTTALSGRDGRILWQNEINNEDRHAPWETTFYQHLQPLGPGGDLDGDGIPDLLATGKTNCNYMRQGAFSPLLAVSGKTGKRLWTADIRVEMWNGPQLLECADLDGDGKPEILFVSASDWGQERGPDGARSTDDLQYWLAVLSGRNGKVLWKQPLSEPGVGVNPARTPFAFGLADLDGDGVRDIVVEAGSPQKDGEVQAFSGRDGKLLWRWVPEAPPAGQVNHQGRRPTLAVGDLDGSGKPVILVLHRVSPPDAKGPVWPHAELLALDGATGKPRWSWRQRVDHSFNDFTNGAVRSSVAPQVVRLAGGKKGVCLWTYNHEEKGQIFLLDSTGSVIGRSKVKFRLNGQGWQNYRQDPKDTYAPYYGTLFRVWSQDLDGDGTDELIYFAHDRLKVTSGGLERVVWEWPLPDEDCDLLTILPATAGRPPTLVVRAGSRVIGLSGADGKLSWTCPVSGTPLAVLSAGEEAWPRVVYEGGNEVTVCGLALPVGQRLPFAEPTEDDPRRVQPLPWYPVAEAPPLLPSWPLSLGAALLGISLAALVLPGALLVWLIRRRRWVLCVLPLLWFGMVWFGACLLIRVQLEQEAGWQIYNQGEVRFAWTIALGLLKLAVAGLPAVAFVGLVLVQLRRWEWRGLALVVLGSLVLAALVGLVWLRFFADALPADQRFSWKGWYALWPAGVYAMGVLILVVFLVRRSIPLVLAVWRRLFRRVRPA